MNRRKVLITRDDLARLEELVECALKFQPLSHQHLSELQDELDRATSLDAEEVPGDAATITMHSEVHLTDLGDGRKLACRIVFPREAPGARDSISVLSPLAAALLGHSAGDVVEFEAPGGLRRYMVEQVIQPRGVRLQAAG